MASYGSVVGGSGILIGGTGQFTANRVPYATAGGTLADSAGLTFDGTGTLTTTVGVGAGTVTAATTGAAASGTAVHAAFAGDNASNNFPGPFTNPDTPRNAVVVFAASWDGGNVTLTGTDPFGAAQTELFTSAAGTTVTGQALWRTITSATKSAVGATANTASIGTGSVFGALFGQVTTALTTVGDALVLSHKTSGTPGTSFGTGILFRGHDASKTAGLDDMARFQSRWTTATAGSETSVFDMQFRLAGATLATKLTWASASLATAASFLIACNGTTRLSLPATNEAVGLVLTSHVTTLATATECPGFDFVGGQVARTNGAGTITTQRGVIFRQPTFSTATTEETVTNSIGVDIVGPPIAGTLDTFVNTAALRLGSANTTIVAAGGTHTAAHKYNAIDVQAHTVTTAGTTQVTAAGNAMLSLGVLTLTCADAVTYNAVSTLYVAGAPAAAGSVTLTKSYSLWIDAGLPRIDSTTANGAGTVTWVSVSPGSTTVQEWLTIDINGTTRYIPCL